jgi:hypothetical protein
LVSTQEVLPNKPQTTGNTMQNKISLVFAVLALCAATSVQAMPILSGVTSGPDDSFSINFDYTNDSTSGETITQLVMDGSTGTAFPILWDSIGTLSGQTAFVSGVDTQIVTFDFTSSWDPTEIFSLSAVDPDGDPGPVSVTIGQLIGVSVGVTFDSGASLLYAFVDDPEQGAGLVLEQISVPEPGTLGLLGIGLAGIGFARKKKA